MKRICYNCGSSKTYVDKNGSAQWYSYKKGNWLCSKCRAKLISNPKWHPIYHAKESKEEIRIANRRNSRIHSRINTELKRIPVANHPAQFALCREYKKARARDLRADYTTPAIDTLIRCIKKIEKNYHGWQPEYDKDYFDIARSRLLLESSEKDPELFALLDYVSEEEKPAMIEALECAINGYLRASIVLGWAAAVYRLHKVVEKMGFDTFNKKSLEMVEVKAGRFKSYDTRFYVRNLSDLQATVSESNLLWVLEYCEFLDSNQHKRLELSYNYRNTSAHPNATDLTYHNVKSFYSDLKNLIFANQKLQIMPLPETLQK